MGAIALRQLPTAVARSASVIVTWASFSASANVVAETSGPTAGAVLNATGAPGVDGVEGSVAAPVCLAFVSDSPRHAAAAATRPNGARMRNCRRVFKTASP
jgi:hypothetical protein